ncbi:NAD(P)/FAD-dependent oxidoreductase [uncultured Dokdonia sp.]|uniref:NAD(P)/FAD-dependent oxidoreductase n=1 Tax=uncultured Dokdonia sp. TaxID=575653 RepID=UPI00261B4AFE|nr:NAD(P)/FAD-dependent oxidoreductase [uncultured Dokdonia sp.]
MKKSAKNIHIIGAGVSGLIAAQVLEKNGYTPIILEATDRVGGRLKTDIVENYQLDHGFQVLLTSYPAARKYLDFDALELQRFLPGAAIFKKGNQVTLGDPLRNISLLLPTLFSGIGSIKDKLKVLSLNAKLKNKQLSEIFETKEISTMMYLQEFGFSSQMIDTFFKPFFSGIFLEPELETSSRMFEFVYKMFGNGHAALPKAGIEAIPKQLLQKLKHSKIQYNTAVSSVTAKEIVLRNGDKIATDMVIIATDPSYLLKDFKGNTVFWKSCDTLYFETINRKIAKPLIGLLPDHNTTIVNNIFYHTSIATSKKANKELLSVTVTKDHVLSDEELINRVEAELKQYFGIDSIRFIKNYKINKALPQLQNIKYDIAPSDTQYDSTIFLAGDTQLNGSLNAAMLSGEAAALGVIEAL